MKLIAFSCLCFAFWSCSSEVPAPGSDEGALAEPTTNIETVESALHSVNAVSAGRRIFRYDTFGDEAFWGTKLRLHEAVATLSPKAALGVGLKVDLDALPKTLVRALRDGQVDLDDPATTLALLKLNAVVGVTGHLNEKGQLVTIGVQCALCHSTVDDALAPGIGHRRDGWPIIRAASHLVLRSAPR